MVTSQQKDHLTSQLTVEINKEDYYHEFEKTLKQYAKTAVIDGFRKGMVPVGRIKKLYGENILIETVFNKVEQELNEYLKQEKMNILGQPLAMPENDENVFDINEPKTYTFNFEIGLIPDVNIDYSAMQATRYKILVPETLLNEEIAEMQIKFGKLVPAETIETEKANLNLSFLEIDGAGNLVEKGTKKNQNCSLAVFNPAIRASFLNKKVGDSIDLVLEESIENKDELPYILQKLDMEQGDAKKNFRLVIDAIQQPELAPLDETLYKAVYPEEAITTEEAFRKQIEKNIEKYFDTQTTMQLHDQYYHLLMNKVPVEFPESFLKKWLEQKENQSVDQVEKAFPEFIKQLKWSSINSKLAKSLDIQVTDEDLEKLAKQKLLDHFRQQLPITDEDTEWIAGFSNVLVRDKKFIEEAYPAITIDKIFEALEEIIPTNVKSVSWDEFSKLVQAHHH